MNYFSRLLLFSAAALMATVSFAGEPKQLTDDGLLKRDPIYIDQGRSIVYSVRHASPRMVLVRLDLASGKTERVHPKSNLVEFQPSYSADAKTLALMRMTGNDQLSLIVVDADSNMSREIKASKKVAYSATITPDGHDVIYNLSGQLFRRNLKTDVEVQLTKSAGRNDWPSVSPDGKWIAFASSREGDYEIYVMQLDGSDPQRRTTAYGLDMRPRWSPDGSRLAWTSNRDGNYEVYLANADGTNPRRLTTGEERDDYPSWHPDGRRLVIVSERDGQFDLYEISAD